MKKLTKILTVGALCAAALTAAAVPAAAEPAEDSYDQVLVFVHTNDVHGAVDVEPYVAAVAAAMEEEYGEENVIVANAGDTWGGATIASLSNGEYIAPIMNEVGYDVMVLGNDDIARGTAQALKVAGMNEFATLSAGWVDAETGEHLLDGTAIFDCDGVKVGVFGVTTEECKPDSSYPTEMLDTQETTEACIQELKESGCDVIVALTHLGFGEDYGFASMTIADNYADVNLIIDGHSHTELPEGYLGAAGGLVVQTGQNGANIGVSKLYLKDGQVVSADTQLIPVDEYTAEYTADAEVSALVDYYKQLVEEQTSQVIGHTDVTLVGERAVVRVSETNLGDALTDAIRDYTGANVALFPSALIRTSLNEGDLTLDNYLSVFGSGADIYIVNSTGAQLKEMLAHGLSGYPEQYMAFPQVSGICVTFAEGEPNVVTSVTWPDGTEIADDESFTLALDLLFIDNFGVYDLADAEISVSGQTDMATMLADYMNSDQYTVPAGTGRVTLESAPVKTFPDVVEGSWYYEAVMQCAAKGIVAGYPDGTYRPNDSFTRAEAAVFAVKAAGIDVSAYEDVDTVFSDVSGWATKWIVAAYENGLAAGKGNGIFDPEAKVTREEFVTMLVTAAGIDADSYADVACVFPDVSGWATKYVVAAYENKLVSGYTDGTFGLGKLITRAEAASIVSAALSNG